MSYPDPVCRGKGYIWENPYNQVPCWRCAGTGIVPGEITNKPNGKISPEAEGDGSEGGGEGRPPV